MRTPRSPAALLAVTIALGAAAAAGPATAQRSPQASPLKRLIMNGRDGPDVYFTAMCRNGMRAPVVERGATGETCATTLDGKRLCRKDWLLRDAGAHACSGGRS